MKGRKRWWYTVEWSVRGAPRARRFRKKADADDFRAQFRKIGFHHQAYRTPRRGLFEWLIRS